MLQFVEHFDRHAPGSVARAVGIFRFLEAVAETQVRMVRETTAFARGGDTAVIWLDELTDHPLVRLNAEDPDAPLLSVRRAGDNAAAPSYDALFSAQIAAQARSEDLELVLGVGLLAYAPESGESVCRHLLTLPVRLDLDEHSGRIDLRPEASAAPVAEGTRFLDPAMVADEAALAALEASAGDYAGNLLDRAWLRPFLRSMVTAIDPAGELALDEPLGQPGPTARCSVAPALILRERRNEGLSQLLGTIADTIQRTGRVPAGLLPLIDPDHIPPALPDPEPGAIVDIDGEIFPPLPLNETQRRILAKVDQSAQVVVQGPPGTGKTHLIAAMLTHLLAQGRRVLVTAQTDKALAQVRAMMPDSIRPLAVSVLNTTADNAADLREAVETLAQQSLHNDPVSRDERVQRQLRDLDRMAGERAEAYAEIVEARARETRSWPESGIDDTIVGIRRHQASRAPEDEWVATYFDADHPEPGVDGEQLRSYRELSLASRRQSSESVYLIEQSLPEPKDFSDLTQRRVEALRNVRRFRDEVGGRWVKALLSQPPLQRKEFQATLVGLQATLDKLRQSNRPWMADAISDVLSGGLAQWNERRARIAELHADALTADEAVGSADEVIIAGSITGLEPIAMSLRAHVADSPLKVDPQGQPRLGLLTRRPVRAATELFERVTVNGHPPVSEADLDILLGHLGLLRLLRLLDEEWNRVTRGSIGQRLREHTDELRVLTELTDFGARLQGIDDWFQRQGWDAPDWRDFQSGRELIATMGALPELEHEKGTRRELEKLRKRTAREASTPHAADCVVALHEAVDNGDPQAYARAYQQNQKLLSQRDGDTERTRLRQLIEAFSPELAVDLADPDSASSAEWERRLNGFDEAWAWARTEHWLAAHEPVDAEPLRERVAVLEDAITRTVERLAGERAWAAALSPDRLTATTRTALTAYTQQVRQLGKGTGRFASRQRAEIRETMNQCRGAVPVWIMPLYRVIDQIEPLEHSFDVIIVDEASQAGLDSLFLHCLAPRIVVVGDDKQVSPAGVGQDRQTLRDLVRRYVPDHPHAQLWANPMRSLFDEATMRYGHRLVLTEHHRSVPEIIEFSNREFYQPDGIRLEPVRQFARSQLDPVRTIFVPDASLDNQDINRAEVEAVVSEIERCVADPDYGGLTFGVVTLLGSSQAKAIETELMRRIPVQEWARRDLLCGEAPAFQGSERDVMFVSMVAAPDGRRLVAQTQDVIAQRYNVAITRARDQVVLVHSVREPDLTNPADLRRRLLSYCTAVENASRQPQMVIDDVPDDVLVPPFDSLLEQQIFNLLCRDGYLVRAQQELLGFRIDLVVEGRHGNLAIECEDDAWEGPQEYARQLRRRRELETSGWSFVTVRRSEFEADPEAVYAMLETALQELDIDPMDLGPAPRRATGIDAGDDEPEVIVEGPEVPFGPEWEAAERKAPVPASAPRVAELEDYIAFDTSLPDPATMTADDLAGALLEIVAVEGPVSGTRLEQAYASAAGLPRLVARQRVALGQALAALVKADRVVVENLRKVDDWHDHAFRLSDQPWARARTLGPRRLEQVPLSEVALLLDLAHYQVRDGSEDDRFRAVLRQLGLARLDERVRRFLRTADELG
ncbi:MAG: AAA domain-containing protein [Propionibacteriaceae bacterium]|nr:AAA domain-containing protein [Propionibacteriaceae bacterium]